MSEASFSEQLISAYVDGQLTGDELAHAEKLIAEDANLADLVEQWRNQRSLFNELPRFKLDNDFASRVLSAASQQTSETLTRAKPQESVPAQAAAPSSVPPFASSRYAFASIVALAAMLLLTLFVFPKIFVSDPGVALNSEEQAAPAAMEKVEADDNQASDKKDAAGAVANLDNDKVGELMTQEASVAPKGALGAADDVAANSSFEKSSVEKIAADDRPLGINTRDQDENVQRSRMAQSTIAESNLADAQPKEKQNEQRSVAMEFFQSGKNVDQFILVEVEEGDDLKQFEEVLLRNRIQFRVKNGLARKDSSTASDMEMLHVYSSPSQMVGAINELSQNKLAVIRGYHIPDRSDYAMAASRGDSGMAMQNAAPMRMQRNGTGAGFGGGQEKMQDPQALQFKKESQHISPPQGFGMKVNPSMKISSLPAKDAGAGARQSANSRRVVETNPPLGLQQDSDQLDNKTELETDPGNSDVSKINEWFGLDRNLGQSGSGEKMQQYLLLIKFNPKKLDSTESEQSEKSDK